MCVSSNVFVPSRYAVVSNLGALLDFNWLLVLRYCIQSGVATIVCSLDKVRGQASL